MHENQFEKYVKSQQQRHKNDMCEVVLVSLSLTLKVYWEPSRTSKIGFNAKKVLDKS